MYISHTVTFRHSAQRLFTLAAFASYTFTAFLLKCARQIKPERWNTAAALSALPPSQSPKRASDKLNLQNSPESHINLKLPVCGTPTHPLSTHWRHYPGLHGGHLNHRHHYAECTLACRTTKVSLRRMSLQVTVHLSTGRMVCEHLR